MGVKVAHPSSDIVNARPIHQAQHAAIELSQLFRCEVILSDEWTSVFGRNAQVYFVLYKKTPKKNAISLKNSIKESLHNNQKYSIKYGHLCNVHKMP